jgi:predicted nucleotidyltransferase
MTDQIEELGEKVLAVLRRNDVERAAFFGSIVRGEMTDESDVDILVELAGR